MKLYEVYHKNRKQQIRIITKSDFTYQTVLYFLSKYIKKSDFILDIGCGVGTVDFYLGSLGVKVLGIDISSNGIEIAKKNSKHLGVARLVKFSRMNFPESLPKKRFDLIVCSEVLEHLDNDENAVKGIFNLLKPGGLVIASSPSRNAPLFKLGLLRRFDREVGHLRRYSLKSFGWLFKITGFEILETKKTEGLLRNFLFTSSFGGLLLRLLNKWPFSKIVTFIDNLSIPIFGESNLYIIAQKK